MADWYSAFVGSEESKTEGTAAPAQEESTWYSMLVGEEAPVASEVNAAAEDDNAEEIEFGAEEGGSSEAVDTTGATPEGDPDGDVGITAQSTAESKTEADTDDWFSKFEEGEKFDAEEEPYHWFDVPLEWLTGRKSRGLTLEIYEHEHHLMELAHEGVVVISEEGIHAAYEHLSHDALIAIAKAHIRFGIVEVHDYDELRPIKRTVSGRELMRSPSGRDFTRSPSGRDLTRSPSGRDLLLEDDDGEGEEKEGSEVNPANGNRKKKRMTTAEVNAEAEAMVARWEAGEGGPGSGASIIPSWFYGHIERLGFVPASKVVKTKEDDYNNWQKNKENGSDEEHSFEKGHSVAMLDENHAKVPVNTEGTILLIKKDGTIMVNFAGYGVAPLKPQQIKKSEGQQDAAAVDAFLKAAAADVDNIGDDGEEGEKKEGEEDSWFNSGGGGQGGQKKKKGFWKWLKDTKGNAKEKNELRRFGDKQSSSNSGPSIGKKKKKRSFKERVRSISMTFSPSASRKKSNADDEAYERESLQQDDIDALNPSFENNASTVKRTSSVSFRDDSTTEGGGGGVEEEEDFDTRMKRKEAAAEEEEEDFDAKLRKKSSLRESTTSTAAATTTTNTASIATAAASSSSTPTKTPIKGSNDSGVKSDDQGALPYGGDLQQAMKAQDRDAIRRIMRYNQEEMANNGGVAKAASPLREAMNKTSIDKEGDEEEGEEEEGDTFGDLPGLPSLDGSKPRQSSRKSFHHHRHYHHHHHHHKGEKKVKSRESVMLDEARDNFNQGGIEGFELPGFGSAKRMTMGLLEFIESISPVSLGIDEEDEYYSDSCSSSSSGSDSYSDSQSSEEEETTF